VPRRQYNGPGHVAATAASLRDIAAARPQRRVSLAAVALNEAAANNCEMLVRHPNLLPSAVAQIADAP